MGRVKSNVVSNSRGFVMILFCYDRLATPTVGYPNLAKYHAVPYTDSWRNFDQHWPRVVPLRLTMYFKDYQCITVSQVESHAWYPIGIGWFDFGIDYFELLNSETIKKIQDNKITILFYYHEGDNPARIKTRLDELVIKHNLRWNCYRFISANTQAQFLENCAYFPDHEFFFRYVNRDQPCAPSMFLPSYEFTAINRLHKWWRASVMSDLTHSGLLDNSLVSYNTEKGHVLDDETDNPLELDCVPGWRENTVKFADYQIVCDHLSAKQHNDHHSVNVDLYHKSKCSIVLETHFDVDQSGGAFLTEKTFKPIKYGQPFVIVGGPGSLQTLRDCGYKVFDQVIDNQYDKIHDTTQRYFALKRSLIKITQVKDFYNRCQEDALHNQLIFDQRCIEPVNRLIKDILCH